MLESRRWDSNPRPADYKSAALPAELLRHYWSTTCRNLPIFVPKKDKKQVNLATKYKELSQFFGMAKVMEIFIRQNFELNIFHLKFPTGSKGTFYFHFPPISTPYFLIFYHPNNKKRQVSNSHLPLIPFSYNHTRRLVFLSFFLTD